MNKFEKLFDVGMSSKQITMLYFRLCDDVRHDDSLKKELDEAHMKAWEKATEREHEAFYKAMEKGRILCTN